ncbi:hypothetical protein, partial [Faecalibacterium duncaniae]
KKVAKSARVLVCFIPVTSPAPILTQLPAKEKSPAQRSGAGLHPAPDCGMLDARKRESAQSGLRVGCIALTCDLIWIMPT